MCQQVSGIEFMVYRFCCNKIPVLYKTLLQMQQDISVQVNNVTETDLNWMLHVTCYVTSLLITLLLESTDTPKIFYDPIWNLPPP